MRKQTLTILLILVLATASTPLTVKSDSISGPADIETYYFNGSYGLLDPSDGKQWTMTVTNINASAIAGNKVFNFIVQDHGTGSGWETLAIQVHINFYGAGGHLLQSYDKGWVLKTSHGFNPGDVPGKFDLRMLITDIGTNYTVTPQFRLPSGSWTTFYEGSWNSSAYELTKTRLAMQIDAGGDGTVTFDKPLAYSEGIWYADPSTTLQAAINAASTDETVFAFSGIYQEAIRINKPVKVVGEDTDTTIIDGNNIPLPETGQVRITATSGNVLFTCFTVRNSGPAGANAVRIGIYTRSSLAGPTYTISHCKIYGTNNPDEDEDYGFYASYGKENIVFTHNMITETGANNAVLEVHTGATEISHNTFDAGCYGADAIFFMTYNHVDITTPQNVSYNIFDMGTGGPFDYAHRSTAISFTSPGPAWGLSEAKFTNMIIVGNVAYNLKSHRRGIGFWNAGTEDNLIAPQVISNTIEGVSGSTGSYGIDFYGRVTAANITGNTIRSVEKAITIRTGSALGTTIRYNNIEANSVGLDWLASTEPANAILNWWGSPTGPYHSELNPEGAGDTISGEASFEPWLLQPYPPVAAVETLLHVNPPETTFWTPSKDKTFTVDVRLDNVVGLFGYDFKLYWDTTLLDLQSVEFTPPWSNYIVAKNETDKILGRYWLAVGAYDSPSFNGSTILAKLTFRIVYDTIYPQNSTCKFDLQDTKLSAPLGVPIYHMVHDGKYSIISTKPTIRTTPAIYEACSLGETFKINITVHDVVNLYNYTFKLTYDTTLLDAITLEIGSFLNKPIYVYRFIIDDAHGEVCLWVWSTGGALPVSGDGVLATITFKVTRATLWKLHNPNILSCLFDLHDTLLVTNTRIEVAHNVVDGVYYYKPKPGDLDYDGCVGLIDLRIVAYYYAPAYNPVADLNEDGVVDIYDLTIVGTYYGEDC